MPKSAAKAVMPFCRSIRISAVSRSRVVAVIVISSLLLTRGLLAGMAV